MNLKRIKKWMTPFIIGGLSCGLLISMTQNYNVTHHRPTANIHRTLPSAKADNDESFDSKNMEGAVKANDLALLHKVGNAKAKLVNNEAIKNGQKPVYKKSSDGNYWNYFEDHYALMSDDYNIKDDNGGDNSESTAIDRTPSDSGIIANEKVLRAHGVKSGVNFEFHSLNDNGNDNTMTQTTNID